MYALLHVGCVCLHLYVWVVLEYLIVYVVLYCASMLVCALSTCLCEFLNKELIMSI